ncbi:uncharacterized protein MELLADRAFT_52200 [Melampsora larici-populina 98AG31]|uniref:FAD/NAD(P)-binding domain-containing protein n=1 Tax=Melampsora larici-populina (strain 98AG31 / pathotype 3-4-7) TaxID=747676 RepID=F4RGW7_MELLP|nr:uncharacterized protein MELLADRAFT_52200 [Melampsora larici-populina 98AG31]EGG08412.1 hypothetical protein MELLADRAFT_52200 [Melampsora larici-populina 98AG31]
MTFKLGELLHLQVALVHNISKKNLIGRIAIIGAGITGVASAAHCVANGFEVVLFEKKDRTGGVWNDVNSTSSLQLNSWLYRFHPSVLWSRSFPKQAEILNQIQRKPTHLLTPSNLQTLRKTVWKIDQGTEGLFDSLIIAIGTCDKPYQRQWVSQQDFHGSVLHSSQLDVVAHPDEVVVIGSGASAVEAVELVVRRGARKVTMIARNDKWIIPRGLIPLVMITVAPWELIKRFHYGDLRKIAPDLKKNGIGLDQSTPIVNNKFLDLIRDGSADYLRGNIKNFLNFSKSFATGFERPKMDFLPNSLFPKGYEPPSLFLLNFSVNDHTVLFTNSVYKDAIGTVGHFHIGIYTRILLMFLVEPQLAPQPHHMRLWVDVIRYLKSSAPTDAFDFFTYVEMIFYLIIFHLVRPQRIKWILFNFFGIG